MENIQYYYLPLTQTLLPVLNADGFFLVATLQPSAPPLEVEPALEPEPENVIWFRNEITGRMEMMLDSLGRPVPASALPGVEDISKAADWECGVCEGDGDGAEQGEGEKVEEDDEVPPEGEEFWYRWKDGHYRLQKEKA